MVNPHPQIYFDVGRNEQGETVGWAAELLPTPTMLKNMKAGWRPGIPVPIHPSPPEAEAFVMAVSAGLSALRRRSVLGGLHHEYWLEKVAA